MTNWKQGSIGLLGDERVVVVDFAPGSDANNETRKRLVVYRCRKQKIDIVDWDWLSEDLDG